MPSDGAPTLEQVGPETVWKSKSMPDLGLSVSSGYEYRVYVLECEASCLYVGIETRAKLAGRLRQHFAGRGAHFTKVHKPRSILMVWPATCTAVESYVYHALLAAQPAGRVEKLGGWTQTSTRVSPLAALQFEQARRSMRGSCFNCGGPHYASSCPKATQGCTYTCPKCKASILVSSMGAVDAVHAKWRLPVQSRAATTSAARSAVRSAAQTSCAARIVMRASHKGCEDWVGQLGVRGERVWQRVRLSVMAPGQDEADGERVHESARGVWGGRPGREGWRPPHACGAGVHSAATASGQGAYGRQNTAPI